MPKESSRIHRVEELIRRELASILQREMRDPRVGMVTISEIQAAKDLSQAKVYVSMLSDQSEQQKETIKVLNDAAGFLRSQVAQRVSLRTTPKLIFIHDESIQKGNRLSRLIDEAIAQEKPSDQGKDES